jgi:hypothetical protein
MNPLARTLAILAYVAVVLGVDALVYLNVRWPFDWQLFDWVWGDIDLFKLIFWLLIPLAFSWRTLDRGWFGFARWRIADVILLITIAGFGFLVLMGLLLFPETRQAYTGISELSPSVKREFLIGISIYTLVWLPAYEFLLRYVMLRAVSAQWPRFGWWLVPLGEGLYHLQKTLPEVVIATLFGMVLSYWVSRRRNGLMAFLAHLAIEIELIILMLTW